MAPEQILPSIPPEIIFDILSKLSITLLCRLKSMSKPWLAMINDLIKARLENEPQKFILTSDSYPYSFYNVNSVSPYYCFKIGNFYKCSLEILGSCSGILLLGDNYPTFVLWNPLTGKRRLIPSPVSSTNRLIEGLGYDSAGNDFKVVVAITDIDSPRLTHACMFSSVSCTWKTIGDFGYKFIISPGANINGSPHWIVGRSRKPEEIIYFDPRDEIFRELPIPPVIDTCLYFQLTVLNEDLCGIINNYDDETVDVWIMKGSSWSKLFVMPHCESLAHVFTPSCLDGKDDLNGVVVIQLNSIALTLYAPKEKRRVKRIKLPRNTKRLSAACYVETLASP